jgi:hypothetical protein
MHMEGERVLQFKLCWREWLRSLSIPGYKALQIISQGSCLAKRVKQRLLCQSTNPEQVQQSGY